VFLRGRFNRPNLFYDIRPKSSNAKEVVDEIALFIKQYYPEGSGIVFCFSKKVFEWKERILIVMLFFPRYLFGFVLIDAFFELSICLFL
jgi:hypothetical protein